MVYTLDHATPTRLRTNGTDVSLFWLQTFICNSSDCFFAFGTTRFCSISSEGDTFWPLSIHHVMMCPAGAGITNRFDLFNVINLLLTLVTVNKWKRSTYRVHPKKKNRNNDSLDTRESWTKVQINELQLIRNVTFLYKVISSYYHCRIMCNSII